jgi:hypothetical protein
MKENSKFGINYPWWASIDDASTRQMYTKARDAGFEWIRVYLPWGHIEKKQGAFEWDVYAPSIGNAYAAGFAVEVVLVHPTPCWAAPSCSPCNERDDNGCRPANPIYFENFAYAAAKKFGPHVAAWALWQEPNAPEQWEGKDRAEAAREYQRLILKPGYKGIKRAYPNAKVTAPGYVAWNLDECNAVDEWVATDNRKLTVPLDAVTVHLYGTSKHINAMIDCINNSHAQRPLCVSGKCPPFWLEEFGVTVDDMTLCDEPAEDPMMTAINVWEHSGGVFTKHFYWLLQGVPPCDCGYLALFHNDLQPIGDRYCTLKHYMRAKTGRPLGRDDECWGRVGCGAVGGGSCMFGDLKDGRPIRIGRFTESGKDEILFWNPANKTYWIGQLTSDQLRFRYANSTAAFGGAEGVSLFKVGDFTGSSKTETLFWYPNDQNYWLGRFNGDQIGYTRAGNTSDFGGAEGASLFWTGDFTGLGKTETLFWFPKDQNYWLGRFTGDQIGYTPAGNTSVFGGAEDVSLIWTGSFTGSGKTELLFWLPQDQNYWLGRFTGDQISYTRAGNTSVFGGAEDVSLIWTGDFTGSGKTELLFWFPKDGNWWSGRFCGNQLRYTLVGNTGKP